MIISMILFSVLWLFCVAWFVILGVFIGALLLDTVVQVVQRMCEFQDVFDFGLIISCSAITALAIGMWTYAFLR